nr:ATPase domain-containing protein [uncultured Pseudomonas sp.]
MEQLKRIHSGITGLDAILKGGLVAGASYIIQGRPGSGKTILAHQVAFNHVREGGRVLVATLLAESHERLFQFLSTLSFFDRSKVGTDIQFISAFDTLDHDGLDEVVKLMRREISRHDATLLIVDGLLNARTKANTQLDSKKFIIELQGHAAFAGCTVLFLTSSRQNEGSPEYTMVDGIIELSEELYGSRSVRRIHLRKTRGGGALSGLHEFEIGDAGLVVYPRIESLYRVPSCRDGTDTSRVNSGIAKLDQMIGGGLPRASITLLMGPSGIGKTSLGINFLAQSSVAEPGLLFGFYETPERTRLKARAIGVDLQALEDSGAMHLIWQPTTEALLDSLGARLLEAVRAKGIKRLVIDSLGGMAQATTNPARMVEFFSALMNELRACGVTAFVTWEMRDLFGSEINAPGPGLSGIVDNLVLMRFVEMQSELKRLLSILKMRDSVYDPALLEMVINENGIDLNKAFKHAESVLSGIAKPVGGS